VWAASFLFLVIPLRAYCYAESKAMARGELTANRSTCFISCGNKVIYLQLTKRQ